MTDFDTAWNKLSNREKDAVVAEVMGWKWFNGLLIPPKKHIEAYRSVAWDKDGVPVSLPMFTYSIAAAFEVVEKFKWAEPDLCFIDEGKGLWLFTFNKGAGSYMTMPSAPTASEAICKAAVMASGWVGNEQRR